VKVILIQDVKKLGVVGDEVSVSDGYARNFLLPRKMALEATKSAMALVESKKKEKQRIEQKLKEEALQIAEKIKNLSCTIAVEAGEGDKLFGSVTSEMVADCLKAEGFEIDKKKIVLDDSIKSLGVYNIEVKLHADVKPQVRIWVIKK